MIIKLIRFFFVDFLVAIALSKMSPLCLIRCDFEAMEVLATHYQSWGKYPLRFSIDLEHNSLLNFSSSWIQVRSTSFFLPDYQKVLSKGEGALFKEWD